MENVKFNVAVEGNKQYVYFTNKNKYQCVAMFWKKTTAEDIRKKLYDNKFPKLGVDIIMNGKEEMNTKPLDFAKRVVDEFPLNIVLCGAEQTGKTYAVIWLTKTLMEDRKIHSSVFVRAPEVRKERNDIGWDFPFDKNADLLVLDDLGTETIVQELITENQDKKGMIFELIEYRISEKLPMFVTTNLNMSELTARYSNKTISRLENNGTIIEFKEGDE
ncbi:MAG TPA: ATP-binding protein [bacterium]|nr:ATP-binding protein [bacterium]